VSREPPPRCSAAEKALTEADTKVGDGDCGATFARGAAALL
jgi:uncharacterized low-complexity protein